MNEFDLKAAEWDKNQMHRKRAEAVASALASQIPLNRKMSAMEFGAGTGLLSFMLLDKLGPVTLVDSSEGMVKVLNEKLAKSDMTEIRVVNIDLEKEDYDGEQFDLIYSLMVLHHVTDVEKILEKFSTMLRSGGYLAIADLYTEDGSFHGHGFTGHRGFDPELLATALESHGFGEIKHSQAFSIEKITDSNDRKNFGVFLMTAVRNK